MSKSSVETMDKKQAFLDNYEKFLGVVNTCKAIGINPVTYWRWCNADEVFSKQCNALKKEIDKSRLDRYEAELDERALSGVSKQSDILLMFGLKALKPDVYREKVADTRLIGDITIKMAIPGYDESLRLTNTIDLKEGDYAIQGQGEAKPSQQGLNGEEA